MRILFLSTWFPFPPDNGSKLRVYHLLRALHQRHQVTLLSFAFGTADPSDVENLSDCCTEVQVVYRDPFERRQLERAGRFFSLAPVVTRPWPDLQAAVDRLYAQTTFDVVIASTSTMAAYALRADPSTRKVIEEHNSFSRWMYERYRSQQQPIQRLRCWVSWQKARAYESRLFRQIDLCTMVSAQDQAATLALVSLKHTRVEVVPNGVDCTLNRPGLFEVRPATLVYNGALTYSANYDAVYFFLSAIYPLIRQTAPEVTFTITGSTKGVDRSGLPLDASVTLSGFVDDIRSVVGSSAVCVVPLRQGSGTRLKILEAMALGTPVIATTKGAEGLEVVSGEQLLIANAPHEFARLTVQLLQDDTLRKRLAAQARRFVEQRHDWQPIGRHFVDMVEDTARDRRGGEAR